MVEINWKEGVPEVAILTTIFLVFFGLPLMLERNDVLSSPSVVFYIILFIIGYLGHIDEINKESFDEVSSKKIGLAIGLGLIGFLIIQIMFFLGLTLLTTTENIVIMDKWELFRFNASFVIAGEELVFRDALPFLLSFVFKAIFEKLEVGDEETINNLSVYISFGLSSLFFGLWHIWSYGFDSIAVLKAILSGVILSAIRIKAGLLASYLAHFTYNSLNIMGLLSYLYSQKGFNLKLNSN